MKYVHFDKDKNIIRGFSESGTIGGDGSSEWLLLAYPEGVHPHDVAVMGSGGLYAAYEDLNKKAARLEFEALEKKEAEANAIKDRLYVLDIKSIRSLREYISKLPDAPQHLKDYEVEVLAERAKLK